VLIEPDVDDEELVATAKLRRLNPNSWHAVEVVPRAHACAAALACKGKRFLSTEAPWLPLEDCDSAQCRCKYRHYADRRGDLRRQEAKAAAAVEQANRRSSRGRRATD